MNIRRMPWRMLILLLLLVSAPSLTQALTLGESVKIALQDNHEIKAMEEKKKGAKYGVMKSVGNFLPTVSLSTNYSRAEGGRKFELPIATRADLTTGEILYEASAEIGFLEEEAHDTMLEIVQPIFQGGALWDQLCLSRAESRAAGHELLAKRQELALRVQEAYYGVLEAEKTLQAMEQAVDLAQEHYRVAEALYQTGMTGRAEILRADVLLSSTQQDRLAAENGLAISRRAFNSLLNFDLDKIVPLAEAEPTVPMDLAVEECVQKALTYNQNLLGFREQLRVAEKSRGLARSAFLPRVNLIFDYGWHEEEYQFNPDADYWMVMGVVSWDLFTSGRNFAIYQQSKAGYRQVEHELRAFRDGVELETTQAYLSLEEARNRLDLAKRALASAEENYRVTAASYREGMAAQVDEIDAQVTLTEARVTCAQTQYDLYKSQARLMNLMGMMPEFN